MNDYTKEITEVYDKTWALVKIIFGSRLIKPKLIFNNRLYRTVGLASKDGKKYEIQIIGKATKSSKLKMLIIDSVISHEIAHSVAFQLYNDFTHGVNWQNIDKVLGGNGVEYQLFTTKELKSINKDIKKQGFKRGITLDKSYSLYHKKFTY